MSSTHFTHSMVCFNLVSKFIFLSHCSHSKIQKCFHFHLFFLLFRDLTHHFISSKDAFIYYLHLYLLLFIQCKMIVFSTFFYFIFYYSPASYITLPSYFFTLSYIYFLFLSFPVCCVCVCSKYLSQKKFKLECITKLTALTLNDSSQVKCIHLL